ncbi:hypothetical protein FNJ84_07325 [Paracoccus sp. M683]|uniref:hypothetical protein n=1 Tax=Paracoccus sp. M683 TaxID=2594268 RepID=UPI00117F03C4|nr:hypothetical protein [Paracoccus sp. M683]TRW97322.1 hypothetical protein FNJ84_07325 [Paracoccus sp. M683]
MTIQRNLALFALLSVPFVAQAEAVLTGPDGLSVALTPEALATMPMQQVEATYTSSKGQQSATYRGVLLWDVIAAETALDDDVKSALRHVVLVTASDDHEVAYSIGEIAPDFGNRQILIGLEIDGAPIAGGLQMVSPGDMRGARYVKDVVKLDIR